VVLAELVTTSTPRTGGYVVRVRVVSLVPSLTEAIAATDRALLVGATDWCTHPADLDVPRFGGTKNPDVTAIIDAAPDLVVVNEEENRRPDVDALQAAGLPVWVTEIRSLAGAFAELTELTTTALGRTQPPPWLVAARAAWDDVAPSTLHTAVIPIWRRPWMHVGSDTFTGDLLAHLGVLNVLADHPERYPKIALAELPPSELVVLPDEPYRFTAEDGPEAFPGRDVALVSGRLLTWYGPSLIEAPAELRIALQGAHPY
jgi:ABC-type Fe3+-hydroxamate transport system substrate-binding protein